MPFDDLPADAPGHDDPDRGPQPEPEPAPPDV